MVKAKYFTHVEVDLNAIQANAIAIKQHTGRKLIAVLKADAYGHGAVPVAETLQNSADMFAVATVDEGIELREAGIINPILILFSPLPDLASEIIGYKLTSAVDNLTLAEELNKVACRNNDNSQDASLKKVKIHVDVNTGMNRCGIRHTDVAEFMQGLNQLSLLEIEGVFTHFATADEVDKRFVHLQLNRLTSLMKYIPNIPLIHMANSAAALSIPESYFDAVRTGLSIYGIYPAKEQPIKLQPALTWKASVGWIDYIQRGEGVSYGLTFNAQEKTRIAGIQVGYGDGYPRELSGKGEVLIGEIRRPILGRICMDMIVVKVESNDNISVGDDVVLIGNQGEEEIGIDEIADHANTISYEILTNIGKRVKRIYIQNE